MKDDLAEGQKLVFALAHEIGNHLGAVRLEADLIDAELDARALAAASVSIDGLAARAGALLALVRPLLSPVDSASLEVPWHGLLRSLQQQLEDEGTQGVVLEFGAPPDAMWWTPSVDWLGALLLALLGATLSQRVELRGRDRGAARGCVRVEFESRDAQAVLCIEDDGPEEDLGEGAALRGRPLVLAIARDLLARVGGRVVVERHADRTRVHLMVPATAIA